MEPRPEGTVPCPNEDCVNGKIQTVTNQVVNRGDSHFGPVLWVQDNSRDPYDDWGYAIDESDCEVCKGKGYLPVETGQ